MEVTLIRHGESLANVGESTELDSPLTDRGDRQAIATANRLSLEARAQAPFTAGFVSPFRRTLMTSARISESLAIPFRLYPDACESFFDEEYLDFAGITPAQLQAEFPWAAFDQSLANSPKWWPFHVENRHDVYRRAVKMRDELKQYVQPTDRIVIVSHAETIGRLVEAFTYTEVTGRPPWTDNCGIWRLDVPSNGTAAKIVLDNDTSHLPPDCAPMFTSATNALLDIQL